MIQQELLRLLTATPRDWRLMGGRLRRTAQGDELQCPITAVASQLVEDADYTAAGVLVAAKLLGLPMTAVADIVAASDDMLGADPLVRMQLMEACGLLVDEGKALEVEIRDWWLPES